MLDTLFNDEVSVRRLAGPRDGHGKPTLKVMMEPDSDVPYFIDCFIVRRRTMARTSQGGTKLVDGLLTYNPSEAPVRIIDDDLLVLRSTGETFRAESIDELKSSVEGSEYAQIAITRTKTPVVADASSPEEV